MKLIIYKCILLSSILFLNTSCAEPNYANASKPAQKPQQESNSEGSPQSPSVDCSLHLKKQDLCVAYQWTQTPVNRKTTSFYIQFYKIQNDTAVFTDPDDSFYSYIFMTSMNHGSNRRSEVVKLETGKYEVKNIFFTMPGDWDIIIKIWKGNEVVDFLSVPVFIPEPE